MANRLVWIQLKSVLCSDFLSLSSRGLVPSSRLVSCVPRLLLFASAHGLLLFLMTPEDWAQLKERMCTHTRAKRRCFTESSSPVICLMLFSGLAWGYGLGEEALRGKGPSRHIIRSTVTCHFLMSTLAAWPGDVLSGFLLPTLSSLEG